MTPESGSGPDLMERLRSERPLVTVELRPPRGDLSGAAGMEAWIDLNHAVRRLSRLGHFTFLTDNAVGSVEEESLAHLAANLPEETDPRMVIPFLTAKHRLEYCLTFAERAWAQGLRALTVVGGDRTVGPPRCVGHGWELRERIRERIPGVALGGWANPHRDPREQVGFLMDERAHVDFVLTQVVSHHSLDAVEAFLEEAERAGLTAPVVFGVFHYRSANPTTLDRLARFFPVPAEEITEEFNAGATSDELTATTIRALRSAGAGHVYVSNLGHRRVAWHLARILDHV